MAIVEQGLEKERGVALVCQMARGDGDAVRQAYETYGDALYHFALRRVGGCAEDAEEIVNDVFVAAIRFGAGFEGRCSEFTWLCGIASGKITDRLRIQSSAKRIPKEQTVHMEDDSKGLLRKVHDPSFSADDIAEQIDRVRLVQALLDTLTPEQREAVTLRYVEGFSHAEIATLMKRSAKAVERLLERAKERPRQEMFKWFGEESFQALCFDLLML